MRLPWLVKRHRRHLHFTPTSASRLNTVEGWFALLARRRLRRCVFRSAGELQASIHADPNKTNAGPEPPCLAQNSRCHPGRHRRCLPESLKRRPPRRCASLTLQHSAEELDMKEELPEDTHCSLNGLLALHNLQKPTKFPADLSFANVQARRIDARFRLFPARPRLRVARRPFRPRCIASSFYVALAGFDCRWARSHPSGSSCAGFGRIYSRRGAACRVSRMAPEQRENLPCLGSGKPRKGAP